MWYSLLVSTGTRDALGAYKIKITKQIARVKVNLMYKVLALKLLSSWGLTVIYFRSINFTVVILSLIM